MDGDAYQAVARRLAAAVGQGPVAQSEARDAAIVECLPLAENLARRFTGRGENYEDLVQVARLGLIQAIDRFDPERGDLLPFAIPTILGVLRRHFRDTGWSARVPRRLQELHLAVNSAITALAQELGRSPNSAEIAARLGRTPAEVNEALVAGNSYQAASLDGSPSRGAPSVADTMGDLEPGYELVEEFATLRSALGGLTDRERTILAMRFHWGMTQTQIAERVGLSQMQVSRILSRVLRALRSEVGTD